jgi:hypothetical protein
MLIVNVTPPTLCWTVPANVPVHVPVSSVPFSVVGGSLGVAVSRSSQANPGLDRMRTSLCVVGWSCSALWQRPVIAPVAVSVVLHDVPCGAHAAGVAVAVDVGEGDGVGAGAGSECPPPHAASARPHAIEGRSLVTNISTSACGSRPPGALAPGPARNMGVAIGAPASFQRPVTPPAAVMRGDGAAPRRR